MSFFVSFGRCLEIVPGSDAALPLPDAAFELLPVAFCELALALPLLDLPRTSSESVISSWCQMSSAFAFFKVMLRSFPVLPSWKRLSFARIGPGSCAERSVQVRPLRSTALTTTCLSSKSTWASRKVPLLPLSILASTWSFTVPAGLSPPSVCEQLLGVSAPPAEHAALRPLSRKRVASRSATSRSCSFRAGSASSPFLSSSALNSLRLSCSSLADSAKGTSFASSALAGSRLLPAPSSAPACSSGGAGCWLLEPAVLAQPTRSL
mmetsp:Transcript_16826/g.46373  ORF Transcript_16826/g.46373 Transcript_16826/m.46373 type:complete len:265 (-) Transcript_16826:286-1080(-)